MRISSPKLDQTRVTPSLARWCRDSGPEDRRSVIVRPGFSADVEELVSKLESVGAEVQSAGAGAITIVVTPDALTGASRLPSVVRIEEPRTLFPKGISHPR